MTQRRLMSPMAFMEWLHSMNLASTDAEVLSCYNILQQYLAFDDFRSRVNKEPFVSPYNMYDRDNTIFRRGADKNGHPFVNVITPPNHQTEGHYYIEQLSDDTYKVRHPKTMEWFIFMIDE